MIISVRLVSVIFSVSSVLTSLTVSPGPIVILVNNLVNVLYVQKVTRIIVELVRVLPRLRIATCVLVTLVTIGLFLAVPVVSVRVPTTLFNKVILTSLTMAIIIRGVEGWWTTLGTKGGSTSG